MALVDGVLRPGYAVKSAIKIALFMLIPLIASRIDREVLYLPLLRPKKKGAFDVGTKSHLFNKFFSHLTDAQISQSVFH